MSSIIRGASLSSAIMVAVCLAASFTSPDVVARAGAARVLKGEAVAGAKPDVAIAPVDGLVVPAAQLPDPHAVAPPRPGVINGIGYQGETEPNGTSATASPIAGTAAVVKGALYPNGDIDFYSFTANAGDRVFAALMTSFSAGNSTDSQLRLFASDGTTVIEFDDDNGTFAALSSSIAGATIPTTGTYFLRVNDFTAGTTSEKGYELHFRLQSGAPTAETEANDTPATANPLPANGFVSGARSPAVATEQDWYSFSLNAGDTVFLSLDVDPERDGTSWNGRLGVALFGDASNQILVVDDAGTGDVSPNPNIPSEAMFMTVKTAGTYFAFVDSASAAVGGPTATYNLSVTVFPRTDEGVNCTTYSSTNVPQTIGPGTGLVSSTITVPGNPRIADVDVDLVLNHALMQDLDVHLRSPADNDVGIFTDIGAAATGGQTQMDIVFDDEAAVTPTFTALRGLQVKPENNSTSGTASTSGAYRLAAFDGENAGGTWTLDIRDDTAGANGGTLTSWSLRICEAPPPPTCAPGFAPTTVYSTDFEAGAAGFTHTGAQDEWELGLPATVATTTTNPIAPFNTCNSGVNCWKTDLDNTYNASSNQDLLSPAINLAGLSPPVVVTWAQRHQVETSNFDHFFVDAQQVGGATPVRLYDWIDPTPISASAGTGNPQVNIGGSYGWGVFSRRADSLAGLNTELRFHLDSDTTVQFGGLAIDDVSVTACRALSADLLITKTDGVATAVPGGSTTYTITASNAGPDPVTGATVADTFPAALTCTWTCVGAGGGTCTAAGSGNLNDSVNLPAGGATTYTATCAISASATGTLANTATVSSAITDPTPGNNSASDTDTLTPQADLAITKTDGVATVAPGGSLTYTITASNAGPSNAPGATVADTFPAALTCTWTCVGAGGGTCTAAGSGNIADTTNLPAGGSTTYTASCTVSGAAANGSTIANTATVAAPAGVTDPTPANNAATDTDTVVAVSDLSITKTDGVAAVPAGGTLTYTIVATNAGPQATTGTVTDTFPAPLTGCTWTCAATSGGTCTASGSGNITDAVNLPATATATYSATCTVPAATADGTVITNTATVAITGGNTDPNAANDSASDTTTVSATADLSITKTDNVANVNAGGTLTYVIAASNAGPQATTGTVTDTFPAGLTCTWTCAGAGGASCTASGTGNIADPATLPSGGTATYTAACVVSGATANGTVINNTATIAAGAGVTDPNAGNNSASDATTVSAGAAVTATKSVAGSFIPGGSVTYTIVLNNTGISAQADNPGDEFTDVLPAQLQLVSASATSGTALATTGTNTVTWNGAIPAGGSVTITITATIRPGSVGTISNQGTVNFDSDGNGTNDSTAQTDDAAVTGAANPTVFGITVGIPTLGIGGLLLMALAMMGFALAHRRREVRVR